jgi:hypothetical protein
MRAMLLVLALAACSSPAPVSSLCADLHPLKGLGAPAIAALTDAKKAEIEGQNCKIEHACGYPIDASCPKDQ